MTERPITLPAWGIRALDHGKTQFRVPLDPQPNAHEGAPHKILHADDTPPEWVWYDLTIKGSGNKIALPWQVGDRLWLKEHRVRQADGTMEFAADKWGGVFVSARDMPREAARHVLTVTGLRVERVGDISEADAVAEGAAHVWGEARPITSFKRSWNEDHPDHPWPDSWILVTEFEK